MAAPAPCTQHIPLSDPLKRGHAGLYDAHFEQFVAFFRDVTYNPKVLVQNLRDVNWSELASAFGDALFSALLCEGTLFRSGKSVDAQRDIAEEFGFLNKLAMTAPASGATRSHSRRFGMPNSATRSRAAA